MSLRTAVAVAFSLMLTAVAHADVDLDISGNLLPPFCTVHDGSHGTISVDFGDEININRLDGTRYRKTVPYQIDCEDDGQPWQLKLKLVGVTAWNNQTLQSDKANLGLRFELAGSTVELGREIPIASRASLPVLTVVPVKDARNDPSEGLFNATANLQAEYY
ncbi:fimbrial protein [Pantoea sp. USHLN256]|uniref:fimbrial protein n=1 Tax=Pantoea sp. USHLN256 TaxID=3081293 RepID=UPI00301B24D0